MTAIELREFLLWSTAINYGILFVWFTVFVFAHNWIYSMHSRWFKLSIESFDSLNYAGVAIYKIGIILFNVVPLIAMFIIS
ncbi:MAG: hypothetical protein V4628_17355 [Pseudomonadota bacterium]